MHVKGQKKKDKQTSNDLQKTTQKKTLGWTHVLRMGSSDYCTSGIYRVTLARSWKRNGIRVLVKFAISIFCNVDTYGSESAGPEWEDCTWMDVGNVAYDLFAKSLKVCVNGIWKHVTIDVKGRIFKYKIVNRNLVDCNWRLKNENKYSQTCPYGHFY